MSTGFRIAMLNTGGPNNKPLEYGGISAAQMKLLETQTLVTKEGLQTGGQYLYDFINGTENGKPGGTKRLTRFKLLESDFWVEEIIKNPLFSNVVAGRKTGIVIPPETSRFLQSVQSDKLDIYSPDNLAAFIKRTDVPVAINEHLQKLYESAFLEEGGELKRMKISTRHYGPKGKEGIDQLITKENAKGFFVLGFMLYQVNSMVELSNLTTLSDELKSGLVDELLEKGAKINVSKKEILERLAKSELDIVMLNECEEEDGDEKIKGKFDSTVFHAFEGEPNKGQVSQLLIKKNILNGGVERVERVVDLQFEDVAESVFVKFKDKTNQHYLVGVMHYSSYDHEPLKDKKGVSLTTDRGDGIEVDSRVNAILNNMKMLEKTFREHTIIVGMDTNSARLINNDIVSTGFTLLSPGQINEFMNERVDGTNIAKKGTSTTETPTVLKARTRFQAQKNKVDLLDCCSKDIIVSLNYDTKEKTPKIFTTNASGFTEAPTLTSQITIDEMGRVKAADKDTFMTNRIPNGDYPFDHFIVTLNADLGKKSSPEAGNTAEAEAVAAEAEAVAAEAEAVAAEAEAEAVTPADKAAAEYVKKNEGRLLLKKKEQEKKQEQEASLSSAENEPPKVSPLTGNSPPLTSIRELDRLSKEKQGGVVGEFKKGMPFEEALNQHGSTSGGNQGASGGGRKTRRKQQRRSQAQRRQSQRLQSRRQPRSSQAQRRQSRRQQRRQSQRRSQAQRRQSRRQPRSSQAQRRQSRRQRQQSRRTQKRRN